MRYKFTLEGLMNYYGESLFTPLIAIILAFIGIVVIEKNKNKFSFSLLFQIYLSCYLLNMIIYSLFPFSEIYRKYIISKNYETFVDLSFTIVEFFVFTLFFRRVLKQSLNRILIISVEITFSLLTIIIVLTSVIQYGFLTLATLQSIFSFQASLLLIPCVVYFITIFKSPPIIKLSNEPEFWIVCGLSFFLICTMPFSLFINYINSKNYNLYNYLYSIFYIFYSLLFVMITRAFLCKSIIAK
jgi:hypothetical protein